MLYSAEEEPSSDIIDQEEHDAIDAAIHSLKRWKPKPTIESTARSDARRLPNWNSPRNRFPDSHQSSSSISPNHHLQITIEGTDPTERSNGTPQSVCPGKRSWNLLPSPSQDSPKMRLPKMNFGGRIVYSRTSADVKASAMELLEIIQSKRQNADPVYLGFDIEWRPTFRRGETQNKTAVMQICTGNDCCFVMHVIHSGIPPILQSLLEDAASVKVGVGIANDAAKVSKDYNLCIKALEDLSGLANLKLGGTPRMWGLGSLAEMLICKKLEKPNKIRLGNWETEVLSKGQLQYAATDAFASWYLHQVLRSFPDAAKDKDVEEKISVAQP